MTDRRFAARGAPARHTAVGAVRDGRDGPRPHAPRLLEGHGRRAPAARAGRPHETRSSTTTATSTDCRAAPRARRRRHGRPRRSPITARNGWTAGSASTSGFGGRVCLHDAVASRTASARCRRRRRLDAHDGVGRGRLLRARLPQRRGTRARGDGRPRGLRAWCAPTSRGGSRRSRTTDGDPIATRVHTPGRAVRRGERRRAGPHRRLRRPLLALGRHRSAARTASRPSRTTRGPTTRTMPRTAC